MCTLFRSLPVALFTGAGGWLFLTAGCTALQTVDPSELRPPSPLTRVSVTRANDTTVVFDSAHVVADTLIGSVNGVPARLPFSEAKILQVRKLSGERTAALVFLGVGGAGVALAIHFLNQPPGPPPSPPNICHDDCPSGYVER